MGYPNCLWDNNIEIIIKINELYEQPWAIPDVFQVLDPNPVGVTTWTSST